MKIKNLKYIAVAAVLGMGTISCEDFLDRPQEDGYNPISIRTMNSASRV